MTTTNTGGHAAGQCWECGSTLLPDELSRCLQCSRALTMVDVLRTQLRASEYARDDAALLLSETGGRLKRAIAALADAEAELAECRRRGAK